jgi:hypothetical protein
MIGTNRLWPVVEVLFQCVGAASVFFIVNAAIGILLVLAIRTVSTLFVSVYLLNPVLLTVFSMIQGFIFWLWWQGGNRFER